MSAYDWRVLRGIPDTRGYSGTELDKLLEEYAMGAEKCPRERFTERGPEQCALPIHHWGDCNYNVFAPFVDVDPVGAFSYTPDEPAPVPTCNDCATRWSCSLEADGPKFEPCPRHRGQPTVAPAHAQDDVNYREWSDEEIAAPEGREQFFDDLVSKAAWTQAGDGTWCASQANVRIVVEEAYSAGQVSRAEREKGLREALQRIYFQAVDVDHARQIARVALAEKK